MYALTSPYFTPRVQLSSSPGHSFYVYQGPSLFALLLYPSIVLRWSHLPLFAYRLSACLSDWGYKYPALPGLNTQEFFFFSLPWYLVTTTNVKQAFSFIYKYWNVRLFKLSYTHAFTIFNHPSTPSTPFSCSLHSPRTFIYSSCSIFCLDTFNSATLNPGGLSTL